MKACLYARVSGPSQASPDKISLKDQETQCKELIVKKGWLFVESYIEPGISGEKIQNRKELLRLLDNAKKKKFDIVVVAEFDRLSRRKASASKIREQLKDNFIQTYSIKQPIEPAPPEDYDPDDNDSALIVETFSDTKSELDIRRIVRNYKMGMRNRVKRGKMVANCPYGYTTDMIKRNGKFEKIYIIDKKKAKIVKRIFYEYLEKDYGTWQIARRLNQGGIPSSQNKLWHRSAIIHIIRNPAYYGKVRYGWKLSMRGKRIITPPEKWIIADGEHKAIINEITFKKVQEKINQKKKVGYRAYGSQALLVGIAKCGYCKSSMYGYLNASPDKGYRCGKYAHTGTCRHNYTAQRIVDRYVLEDVLKLANTKAKKAMLEKKTKSNLVLLKDNYKQSQNALKGIKNRLERNFLAYEKGVINIDEL